MSKSTSIISGFIVVLILAIGCSSTQKQREGVSVGSMPSDNDSNTVKVDNVNLQLSDYLRRLPGVTVKGHNEVLVRGVNSIEGNNSPLFVVDGVSVGRDFNGIRSIVEVENINYVRVLKGPDATMYGIQGGNGVIEIITR